jgi:hypothetical protein
MATQHKRAVEVASVFTADQVWGAACAAFRINSGWIKEDQLEQGLQEVGDGEYSLTVVKQKNGTLMRQLLKDASKITDEDVAAGRECRAEVEQRQTYDMLMGRKVGAFDVNVQAALAQETFDMRRNGLMIGIIGFMPEYVRRATKRDAVNTLIAEARSEPIAKIGQRVNTEVRVVDCRFSPTYNVYYLRAVDMENRAIRFSYKAALCEGQVLKIRATVTEFTDGVTRVNRVSVK